MAIEQEYTIQAYAPSTGGGITVQLRPTRKDWSGLDAIRVPDTPEIWTTLKVGGKLRIWIG